jgi:hypothetical protein
VAKPVVDGLEKKLDGKAEVVRLDVLSSVGQQAARQYGIRGVPALVVVDGSGQAVFGQAGIPRPGQVIEQVEALIASP